MLAVVPDNLLQEGVRDVPVSRFVASLLSARDSTAVVCGFCPICVCLSVRVCVSECPCMCVCVLSM